MHEQVLSPIESVLAKNITKQPYARPILIMLACPQTEGGKAMYVTYEQMVMANMIYGPS